MSIAVMSIQTADALKGSGQFNPQTRHKNVCGDRLCSEPEAKPIPKTVNEKMAEEELPDEATDEITFEIVKEIRVKNAELLIKAIDALDANDKAIFDDPNDKKILLDMAMEIRDLLAGKWNDNGELTEDGKEISQVWHASKRAGDLKEEIDDKVKNGKIKKNLDKMASHIEEASKIAGTIPEFGPLASIVLSLAIIATVVMTRSVVTRKKIRWN
jgi:hypothetical protein